jgi:hypothetical protein
LRNGWLHAFALRHGQRLRPAGTDNHGPVQIGQGEYAAVDVIETHRHESLAGSSGYGMLFYQQADSWAVEAIDMGEIHNDISHSVFPGLTQGTAQNLVIGADYATPHLDNTGISGLAEVYGQTGLVHGSPPELTLERTAALKTNINVLHRKLDSAVEVGSVSEIDIPHYGIQHRCL